MSGLRVGVVVVVLSLAVAGGVATAKVPPEVGRVCTAANAVAGGQRDSACWPFASSSPWNTPIGASASLAPSTSPCTRQIDDPSLYTDIASTQWSIPQYIGRSTDPLTAVYTYNGGSSPQFQGNVNAPIGMAPAKPSWSAGGDAFLAIVDPTHSTAYELWQARRRAGRQGSGWISTYGNTTDLHGSGIGQGGPRAFGGSALGGLIRTWELARSQIPHALALAIPYDHQTDSWVWPAISNDGADPSIYTGAIPMGQLVAIPKSYGSKTDGSFSLQLFQQQLSLQTSVGTMIALAARDYGVYIVDSDAAGGTSFYAEPWAASLVAPALNVTDSSGRSDAAKIQRALHCVTNNSSTTPGGPGSRLAPAPPPLG